MQDTLTAYDDVMEIDVSYSKETLVAKLSKYQLNSKNTWFKISVNKQTLNKIKQSSPNNFLLELSKTIKEWQTQQSLESFTTQINQLVFLSINAVENDVAIQDILDLFKSFRIKSLFSSSNTSKLHLFLSELIAESITNYQQHALQYTVNYDFNTHLPNTKRVLVDLQTLRKASDKESQLSVISIYFQASKNKLVFSKKTTLEINKKIANVLRVNINEKSQLHIDGDSQFDLLITSTSNTELNLFFAKIHRAFEELLDIEENQSILMTPFIGCATAIVQHLDVSNLYDNAKLALASAIEKQQPLVMYNDDLQKSLLNAKDIENKVLESFGNDNFTLHLQPIVDLENLECTGAELLLRWSEKANYTINPSLTVEIINKVGKGKLFTRWLINSACRYASELIHDHHLKIYLTINLRAEDLYDAELPHLLSQAIALWKIKPKDIILEITENGILEYNEDSNSVINQLAELGFIFALDDFGTGFSSLTRLRLMPIDLIKIDQSFVKNINLSKDDFEIVQSIATLADGLGKEVLAEGIEDEHCLSQLRKLKINKGQGYFFAKPMSFEKFVKWVESR